MTQQGFNPSTSVMRGGAGGVMTHDPLDAKLHEQRIIFLDQQVDDEIASKIVKQMLVLAADDPQADITLYIMSPGGSVTAGMAIFDTMETIECDVATYAVGLAASMGQFLLSAGTPGKRYALPRARILMHQGSAGIGGTESDIVIQAELYSSQNRELAELTAGHTGKSVEQIIAESLRDHWFTAEEARKYGFVDHVLPTAVRVAANGNGSAPQA